MRTFERILNHFQRPVLVMRIHVVFPSLSGFSEVADSKILPQRRSPFIPQFLLFHVHVNPTLFFGSCPAHPNPLVRSIGNYSLADLHRQYKKYIHKRPKHILL